MALSRSLQKGQAPLSCQLCEESIQIKWKCMDCQLLMCTKCRDKIHPKFKNAEKHKVVDIKSIAERQSDDLPDLSSANCDIHAGQLCCLYCKECQEVVCPLCIAKTHNKHNMVELSEGYNICKGILENVYGSLSKDTMKLGTDVSKLELIKQDQTSKYEEEKQTILKKENELTECVKMKTKSLLTQLEKDKNNLFKSITSEKTNAKELGIDLKVKVEQIASALKSKQAEEVFKMAKKEENITQKFQSINTQYKSLPVFVPIETLSSNIESIFGSLQYTETRNNPTNMEIQVENDYITDLEVVDHVKCCSDGSLWLNYIQGINIQNVSCQSNSLKINKTIDICAYDMTLTPSGDLLLSTRDTHLQVLSPTTRTPPKTCYSVSPLITTAVHVTKDYKVIVGAVDSRPDFSAGGPRQVIVMDRKGRHEMVHHLDTDNKPFTPIRITTDSKNNLYVINSLSSDNTGRVEMLSVRGGVRGVYTGHLDTNKHPFTPVGVVTTQSDNIIVSDTYNHTLHILNTDGQCVTYLDTRDTGIMFPYSLDIDSQGRLFIGCSTGKGSTNKAKLYMVKLSGL